MYPSLNPPTNDLRRKEDLLQKISLIAEATAEEMYNRIETLPARELVALLTSSIELQSKLQGEIKQEKIVINEATTERTVDAKYDSLGINKNNILTLLAQ